MLFDLTGIDPTKVPLDDKETMSIFSSTDALGVTPEQIGSKVGSNRNTKIRNKIRKRNVTGYKTNDF